MISYLPKLHATQNDLITYRIVDSSAVGFYHVLVTVVLVDSSKQCLLRTTMTIADNTTLQDMNYKIQITS